MLENPSTTIAINVIFYIFKVLYKRTLNLPFLLAKLERQGGTLNGNITRIQAKNYVLFVLTLTFQSLHPRPVEGKKWRRKSLTNALCTDLNRTNLHRIIALKSVLCRFYNL